MANTRTESLVFVLLLVQAACGGGGAADGDETGATSSSFICEPQGAALDIPGPDPSACSPGANDYVPGGSDAWPQCVTDDREYHLIADTPSSIARVEAYLEIKQRLMAGGLGPEDFTYARTIYSSDEGLESRVLRREDLRYPEIPREDWDPGVDPDKQCTVPANVEKYPDRCAGPARIAPLLEQAFAAGQLGEGDPEVHAAQIDAALSWFLYISVYKEANTCASSAAKDCDSAWAYYTGGSNRAGGIGLAAEISSRSEAAHHAIWDGFSAFRCWRDLYPAEQYPTLESVPEQGHALLGHAQTQLRTALDHGWAQLVRAKLATQPGLCGVEAEANWAFLRIAGPRLELAGKAASPDAWAELEALWAREEPPTAADLEAGIATLDGLFACPRGG